MKKNKIANAGHANKAKFQTSLLIDLDVMNIIRKRAAIEKIPYKTWINRQLKTIVTLSIFLFFAGCGHAQSGQATVNSYAAIPHNSFVFLGDSITWGVRVGPPANRVTLEQTFFYMLEQSFPNRKFVNAGVPGNTSAEGLARFQTDVIDYHPDTLVVMFGTNDITRISLDDFRANMQAIVQVAMANGISVVLMTEPRLADEYNGNGAALNAKLDTYMNVTRAIASQNGFPIVDNFEKWTDLDVDVLPFTFDGCHPNEKGHELIASALNVVIGVQ